jgi:Spy/CpxP family protein refolding chaperone
MKHAIEFAVISALAAGIAFAQAPTPSPSGSPPAGAHGTARNLHQQHMANIAQKLNLTDAQRREFDTIFQQAHQTAMPLRDELKTNRDALTAAVKANRTADIEQLATARGKLMGQMTAIFAQARAKFYQTLAPEQRAKYDQMRLEFRQQMRDRWSERDTE